MKILPQSDGKQVHIKAYRLEAFCNPNLIINIFVETLQMSPTDYQHILALTSANGISLFLLCFTVWYQRIRTNIIPPGFLCVSYFVPLRTRGIPGKTRTFDRNRLEVWRSNPTELRGHIKAGLRTMYIGLEPAW